MQTPKLSLIEQRRTLSSKKKKKKISKNVLGLPDNALVRTPQMSVDESSNLTKLLVNLLPEVRLPIKTVNKKSDEEPENTKSVISSRKKRSQLSIGVNDLTRSIKKFIIAAALFADDIVPSHLIKHLKFLCSHNKIPFLLLPQFRKITNDAFGYPCIALGFRKDGTDFSSVVEAIKSIAKVSKSEDPVQGSLPAIPADNKFTKCSHKKQKIEKPQIKRKAVKFVYKYRTNCKERAFIPSNAETELEAKEKSGDFLLLTNDESDRIVKSTVKRKSISSHSQRKRPKLSDDLNIQGIGINEEEEVKKKRLKKDWVIDKQGEKSNFKFARTNIVKMQPNYDRRKLGGKKKRFRDK